MERVAQCFDLKGLGSADFLVNGEDFHLLEINPRPGATLDIFDSEAEPLLRIHLEAVLEQRLPDCPLNLSGGERRGHRLRNGTDHGVTIDGLARMDRRSP